MNFDGEEILFLAKDSKSRFVRELVDKIRYFCGYWDSIDFRSGYEQRYLMPQIRYVNGICVEENVVSSKKRAYGVIKARRNRYFFISNRNIKR